MKPDILQTDHIEALNGRCYTETPDEQFAVSERTNYGNRDHSHSYPGELRINPGGFAPNRKGRRDGRCIRRLERDDLR